MPRTRTPDYKVTADGLLEVRLVTRPHGLTGEIRVHVPPEYRAGLLPIRRVYLAARGEAPRSYKVEARRPHQDVMLYRLEGIASRNDAESVRGAIVLVQSSDLPALDKGRHYPHELIGLRVVTVEGRSLGEVFEVLVTRANDVYVVKETQDSPEILLPAIEAVVRSVDLQSRVMTVMIPEGL